MAARKKSSTKTTRASKLNKDLLVFIVILIIVAIITYVLTYNAIMTKFDQMIATPPSADYLMTPAQ